MIHSIQQRDGTALAGEEESAHVKGMDRPGAPVDSPGGPTIEITGSPNGDATASGHGDANSAANGSSSPMELVDEEMAGALELDGGDEYIPDDYMQDLRRVKVLHSSF